MVQERPSLREEIILALGRQPMPVASLHHYLQIDKGDNLRTKDFAKALCQLEDEDLIHLPDYGDAELTEAGQMEEKWIKKEGLVTGV